MKRLGVILTAFGALLLSAVAVAGSTAAVAGGPTTLTGTADWFGGTFDTPTTTLIHGTFNGKLGKGAYEGTLIGGAQFTTGDCGPVCEPVSGAIRFSGSAGRFTAIVEPGSVVALVDIASHSWRNFTLTLRITDGTRRYAHANGLLSLSYTSTFAHYFDYDTNEFVETISDVGTLTGDLHWTAVQPDAANASP